MYCTKCGTKIEENWKFCPNCQNNLTNAELKNNDTQNGNEQIVEDNGVIIENKPPKKQNVYIYIILFFMGIIGILYTPLDGLFFLLSLISIVSGLIYHPESKGIKVLFVVFLIITIIFIIMVISFLIACANAINSCPG